MVMLRHQGTTNVYMDTGMVPDGENSMYRKAIAIAIAIALSLAASSAVAKTPLSENAATLFAQCSGVIAANVERGRRAGASREQLFVVAMYGVSLRSRAAETLGEDRSKHISDDAKKRDLEYDSEEEDDVAPGLPSIDECMALRSQL